MPLQRRVPKRGFTNVFRKEYSIVNVGDLDRYPPGSEVGVRELQEAGLVRKIEDGVKLLGNGDIQHVLVMHVHKASATALKKIEAAGGRVELIPFEKRS
jgi:large subunit ribosomal protein L15